MKVQLRRYVWVIDLIGMLAGAALAGHLVAIQFVSAMSSDLMPVEPPAAASSSRRAQPIFVVPASGASIELPAGRWPAGDRMVHIERHYDITRADVDRLFDGLSRLPHGVRIVPTSANDRPVGVQLIGDSDGLLRAIGLASGDIVLEANGVRLTNPSALLAAYTALQQTSEPWLVIKRGGRAVILTYAIVDSPPSQSRWSARQAAVNSSCVP